MLHSQLTPLPPLSTPQIELDTWIVFLNESNSVKPDNHPNFTIKKAPVQSGIRSMVYFDKGIAKDGMKFQLMVRLV